MNKPLLTVAIPTYNRSNTLKKVLNQLSKEKNQSFQIIVSDDSSSDDTEIMVKKYQKSLQNLSYHKNEVNLGHSGNILKLYDLAKTRYIWFLSDDEIVLPGAIEKIIKSITKYKPVVAFFNHVGIDSYQREFVYGAGKDKVYKKVSQLKDYGVILRACFISVLLIEKRLPIAIVKRAFQRKNIFSQLSLSIMLLNDKFKLCEFATPVVFRNSTYESGEFFKFLFTDFLDAAFFVNSKLEKKEFVKCGRKELLSNLQLFLSQKIGLYKYNDRPSLSTIKKIIKYYGIYSPLILLFPVIYFLIPAAILKFMYRNRLIRMHGRKIGLNIYKNNLNRVFKIKPTSGFVRYR